MAQVNMEPSKTEDVGRVHAQAELKFQLVAEKEATFSYAKLSKTSSGGAPATATEEVDGIGNHRIELSSEGGRVEFTVESPDGKLVEFNSDEPGVYHWQFVGDPNWSGGSINEEATEIAKMAVEGKPLPSKEPSGEIPEKSAPALSSEFTRPWEPDAESGPTAPRKGNQPVFDGKEGETPEGAPDVADRQK